MFHADSEEQWIQIKNTIDMSDYYILTLGRYCGTFIESEGISYTEKEYNYAIARGIPILSFVISDDALKAHYGNETRKQQRAYAKFKKRVLSLPCDFWKNTDDLTLLVTTALSMKSKEIERDGWVRNNPSGIVATGYDVPKKLTGDNAVFYFSASTEKEGSLIQSELVIESNGRTVFKNNISAENPEYTYQGICIPDDSAIYVYLKNDHSNERVTIVLTNPVGYMRRYIGLITALSPDSMPVCTKIACISKSNPIGDFNMDLVKQSICCKNRDWNENLFTIETKQRNLFYSNDIFK